MALKKITAERYAELLAAGEPAATSAYGFLGEPMGFKEYRDKLAPSFKRFYRWPGLDDHYESDKAQTVEEFRNSVWEYEADDRATDRMTGTLQWLLDNPGKPIPRNEPDKPLEP